MFATMLVVIQLVVSVVVGLYFFRQLRQSRQKEPAHGRESNREMERMRHLRSIHLSEPLAEKVRPTKMSDVIGQEDGIRKTSLGFHRPQYARSGGKPCPNEGFAAIFLSAVDTVLVCPRHQRHKI